GFLLSMVGKDYESTKIEKTFNLKSNKLVLRTQAPWETVAVKKDFASDSLEFCGKLEAIKTDIQKAVEGDPVYFKAEPRLAPVADQLQKIYDSKCFQELSVRQPGNHPTTYVVKLANMSKELDSGFLLSMVGKDYTSTKIEKTFNFETSKLVLRTQAPWETAAVKNDFASDNPEYCSKLEAIKADIQNAVKGDPVYFKAEPRLAPVADQLQKIFDGKCKKS
ncbi:MAG: hypothetical protein NTX25_11400, partial [Proteobacteria bacterium]|nr:hypothetical protein [Pseudomonadota bacterium]